MRRLRARTHRGADGGAAAPGVVRHVLGRRSGLVARSRGGQGARSVSGRERDPGRLLHARHGRRRLGPRGDADARASRARGRLDRVRRHRGARHRRRTRAREAGADQPRRRRGGDGRDLLRGVEPARRSHGGRDDPVDARGPPDDRRRAGAALRGAPRRRSSTRSSGTWIRTCTSARTARTWRSARMPIARSCGTPTRSRRSRRPSFRRPSSRSRRRTSSRRWSTLAS